VAGSGGRGEGGKAIVQTLHSVLSTLNVTKCLTKTEKKILSNIFSMRIYICYQKKRIFQKWKKISSDTQETHYEFLGKN
jgi:hypothetical protein